MNNINVLGSNDRYDSEEVSEFFTKTMMSDIPLFFGRVGGSDYDAIGEYYHNKNILDDPVWYDTQYMRLKRFNGFFDFENKKETFKEYLEQMIKFYKSTDHVSYCNDNIIKQFDSMKFTEANADFLQYILDGKTAIHYDFLQKITPFVSSFKNWGENKKILIVSPLSKSLEHQYKNIDKLYHNYKFPNFKLSTYNTKITYSNGNDTKEDLRLTTNNWHEEAERMAREISTMDFDIAFLSCASYSMYLGDFIKNKMNKKAVYIGGCLNVMFNIYGGRYGADTIWENIYKEAGLNLKYQIDPLENAELNHIKSGRGKRSESLNAYFGSRDGKYTFKKIRN